jgi:hypothetical protein
MEGLQQAVRHSEPQVLTGEEAEWSQCRSLTINNRVEMRIRNIKVIRFETEVL